MQDTPEAEAIRDALIEALRKSSPHPVLYADARMVAEAIDALICVRCEQAFNLVLKAAGV